MDRSVPCILAFAYLAMKMDRQNSVTARPFSYIYLIYSELNENMMVFSGNGTGGRGSGTGYS
jgi:hypothetical protein